MAFASVRVRPITSRTQLHVASAHALRLDNASQRRRRPDATAGAALARTGRTGGATGSGANEESQFSKDRDVVAAFDVHLAAHGAHVTTQGGYGLHAMISVSRDWVEAAGDLHNPDNPRNRQLITEAVRWVQSWAGQESVYAARLDLDETGGGNVDVFVAPIRIDGRSKTPTVSHSKPLTELRLRRAQRMAYVALQDDWADHCRRHLDSEIRRGVPKAETMIGHLEVEAFKAAGVEAQRRLRARLVRLDADLLRLRELLEQARAIVATAEEREALARIARDAEVIARRR